MKALSSVPIAVKIEKLFNYIDRGFMASSYMKSFHDMFSVANSITSYLDYIAEQNEGEKAPPEKHFT